MRVAFFGQSGPYAPNALRSLLGASQPFELALVVQSSKHLPMRRRQRLVRARPGPIPENDNLTAIANAGGIDCLQTTDVNHITSIERIAAAAPDWLVCVGFDRLFSRELLAVPRMGGINAHPSPLPALRGPAPIFWALRNGHNELAVTLHGLDVKEDHGEIFMQEKFALPRRATGAEIFQIAGSLAGRMLLSLLGRAASGRISGIAQDHSRATRAPRPAAEDSYVEPGEWYCEPLLNFVSGAAYFRAAWTRFGDQVFHFRRGLNGDLGRRLPADYLQQGAVVMVQCRDGVAHLEAQV